MIFIDPDLPGGYLLQRWNYISTAYVDKNRNGCSFFSKLHFKEKFNMWMFWDMPTRSCSTLWKHFLNVTASIHLSISWHK